jgi:8-oxo-dGTP diphosphatase
MSSEPKLVEVAIALVWRGERLLVTRRPARAHLGGFWEFPGGKIGPAETPLACAEREVAEETNVTVRALAVRTPIAWEYPERRVLLHPVDCEWLAGEGETREVAELRWTPASELVASDFPPANAELVKDLAGGNPSRKP